MLGIVVVALRGLSVLSLRGPVLCLRRIGELLVVLRRRVLVKLVCALDRVKREMNSPHSCRSQPLRRSVFVGIYRAVLWWWIE